MRAVIGLTLLAALCVAAAWWVAGLPGDVAISIAGTSFEAKTPVALTLLALLFLAIYAVVRVLAWLVHLPRSLRRGQRDRHRTRGDAAVTRTLVALAANDGGAARREAERSRRFLGDTPLTLLLAAQAGRQAGREGEAEEVFRALAARSDGKLLGLRGLLRQAVAREDWPEAAKIAQQAEAAHPGAAWLTDERQRLALQTGQYGEALRLMGPGRRTAADAGTRAALGVVAAEQEAEPKAALRLAKQAFEAEPGLAPASLLYAARLRGEGRERSALEVLRRTWSLLPQPGIVEAYLEPVTDRLARHRAAGELATANPAHPDTALMLARTALDAGLTGEARRHAETARNAGLNDRRLWLLMADIAEADGDGAASQEALRQIPRALPEPAWRCLNCGTVHQAWHAVCDACATPGRIRWGEIEGGRAPVARVAAPAVIEGLG